MLRENIIVSTGELESSKWTRKDAVVVAKEKGWIMDMKRGGSRGANK